MRKLATKLVSPWIYLAKSWLRSLQSVTWPRPGRDLPVEAPAGRALSREKASRFTCRTANTWSGRSGSTCRVASPRLAHHFSSSRTSPSSTIFTWRTCTLCCSTTSMWSPDLNRWHHHLSLIPTVLFRFLSNFQSPGFAIIIDRREACWQEIQKAFSKIVSVFPGKIKEVFLLYKYPDGKRYFSTLSRNREGWASSEAKMRSIIKLKTRYIMPCLESEHWI